MTHARPNKIINLISALLVLLAGFYVVLFMPLTLSPMARVIIAVFLVVYFLFRLKLYKRKYKSIDEVKDGINGADS